MSEKNTPAGQHDEDDLLTDFRDVAGDDGDTSRQPDNLDTDLEALNAFLDEFGQSEAAAREGSEPAEPAVAADEMAPPEVSAAAAAQPADVADPLLEEVALADADPVLDLSTAAEDVPELSADVAPAELDLGGMEDMVPPEPPQRAPAAAHSDDLFAASPVAAPATAPAPVSIMADEDEATMDTNKTLDISTIGVALISLVIAAVAGWFAVSLHGQMHDLHAELARLRQAPAGAGLGPDRQTQENLARLTQRVNEMAVLLDGPLGHLSDSGAQIDSMNLRLEALEQRIEALSEKVAQATPTAAAARKATAQTAAPVQPLSKAATKPTTAVKPAAVASQPTGGWVVNVASLTDAKAAEAEKQRLQQAGFNVEVQTARMDGRTWYRVRATGFGSREQAQVYSDMIRHKMGVTPWVGIEK